MHDTTRSERCVVVRLSAVVNYKGGLVNTGTKPSKVHERRMSLVDIGANLAHKLLVRDLSSVLSYAVSVSKLCACVITTTQLNDLQRNVDLCRQYEGVLRMACTVGIHPHNASSFSPAAIEIMRKSLQQCAYTVVAVGETGLDYNRMFSSPEQQVASFRAHVALACELRKPLFLHERDAHKDFLSVLDSFENLPPVVVHCFTGNDREASAYLRRGFFLGLTGFVAMSGRGQALRSMLTAGTIPLERIMVETDCPFMAPDGSSHMLMNARRNEPVTLSVTVKVVAECLGVPYDEVASSTTEIQTRSLVWVYPTRSCN
jgi:TatD family hydrolase